VPGERWVSRREELAAPTTQQNTTVMLDIMATILCAVCDR